MRVGPDVLAPGTVLDIGDHSVEVLAAPDTLSDRYRLRIEADPGGPGITGDFPHLHPKLVETFTCVSGEMLAKVGKEKRAIARGETVEVPEGQVHGFLNTGGETLVVESEVIFPDGYDRRLDIMHFADIYDRLKRDRPDGGEPPLLQMAVLTHEWREVIRQPGVAGALMPSLAAVGKLLGYRPDPFGDNSG